MCRQWIAIFISRYVCLPRPALAPNSVNSFFTFHVYLWIDYHCQIPSLALLAGLNTYSKVTAVTGRRWAFLWKPFLPHISKCISLIYCHMLVKPCFRFLSWHRLLQNLDCSSGGSHNCSPYWFKEGFPSVMQYCGQNTGNRTWCLTRTLGKITKLCNYINMQSVDDSPTVICDSYGCSQKLLIK